MNFNWQIQFPNQYSFQTLKNRFFLLIMHVAHWCSFEFLIHFVYASFRWIDDYPVDQSLCVLSQNFSKFLNQFTGTNYELLRCSYQINEQSDKRIRTYALDLSSEWKIPEGELIQCTMWKDFMTPYLSHYLSFPVMSGGADIGNGDSVLQNSSW